MKKIMKILGVVLALVLVFGAVGCAIETPETGLGDRIVALENRMSGLEAAVANISIADTSALSSELSALRDELAGIGASMEIEDQAVASLLASLRHRIEALENGNGNGNGNGEPEPELTARWSHSAHALTVDLTSEALVDLSYTINPSTVEEPDVYKISLYIENLHPENEGGPIVVEFNFTPRHGAIVYVDEVHTYMDTMKFPYTYWDVGVIGKGDDKHTTRISCLSETINIPDNLTDRMYIRLEFTLAYK